MEKTSKISIYVITALMVSIFGFSAHAAPSVVTGSVVPSSNYLVNVYGTVNPNGSPADVSVEYGTTNSLGQLRVGYTITGTQNQEIRIPLWVDPSTTYYYRVVASGTQGEIKTFTTLGGSGYSNSGGNTSTGTSGTVNNGNNSSGGYNNGTTSGSPIAPSAVTNGPASVSSNSAVVNGSINPNNVDTKFWFELGTTQSLGKRTSIEPAGTGSTWQLVTGNLSGLTSGTTYYYRVVAQNNLGTAFGDIRSFVTSSSGTTGTPTGSQSSGGQVLGVASGSTGGGSKNTVGSSSSGSGSTSGSAVKVEPNARPSFASLEYSLDNGGALVVVGNDLKPNPGEEFNYTIVYKNDTLYPFNEAVLKVIIPIEADYLDADIEPLKISANTVEFDLGNIQPGSRGTVTIVSRVKETAKPGSSLIYTSVLGYKDRFGTQLATTSYLTVRVGQGVVVALSAFSLGSFIGSTGVIILIIFTLIILAGIFTYGLIRIRKGKDKKKDSDDLANFDIPSTFEPIGPATSNITFRR